MPSSVPKLSRTAKEILLIQKKTYALYLRLFSVSEYFFSDLARQLFTRIYLHSGRAATEHTQTTVRQSKKEKALPLLQTKQPDV